MVTAELDASEHCRICGDHVPLPHGVLMLGKGDTVYLLCDACAGTPGDSLDWRVEPGPDRF